MGDGDVRVDDRVGRADHAKLLVVDAQLVSEGIPQWAESCVGPVHAWR